MKLQTLALLGTYVPRQCGIGTFTKDLREALALKKDLRTMVLAMDDTQSGYPYPPEVRFQIQASRFKDYQVAADLLNINQIDAVLVQHEFGIFGGRAGDHVIALLRKLRMPTMVTLHTVLAQPNSEQMAVMRELIALSDRLVVMCSKAVGILTDVYKAPAQKITVIPHGIPDVPFTDPAFFKDQFDFEGRPTLLTFGLLSPGKGLEVVIEALPTIAKRHPEVVYVILGAIHPHVFKSSGNSYLASLELLAEKRGVRDHVVFHNRFVNQDELCRYLGAADVFITPYPNKAQITSGTLAYAMGAGKAVVSTPYWYAEEMLAEDRGRLFPFGDSSRLAELVNELLDDPVACAAMRKRAYLHCRPTVWKEVGRSYARLARAVLRERAHHPRPVSQFHVSLADTAALPEVSVTHLREMTDDTGILQHAVYATPDRNHGYCADDNARALVAATLYQEVTGDESLVPLAGIYLAFLHHAYNPATRRFRNFMSYGRTWQEEVGSEDVHGRSLWALGLTTALGSNNALLSLANRLFCNALESMEAIHSPRSWAFALVGIHAYLRRFSGDSFARRMRDQLALRLYELFTRNSTPDWPWCEEAVTYDNAKLPHALILSGQWMPHADMLSQGLRSLDWLVRQQIGESGRISLIGNQGWMTRSGQRARFDQQPVEAMSMVEACAEAYHCTGEPQWRERARSFLNWFLGNNDTESMLYDSETGGCRDGLHANGPNLNQGAESTLAWLVALLSLTQLRRGYATGIDHPAATTPVIDPAPAGSVSSGSK